MIHLLPYIQGVVIWSMSHRLIDKVQFNAIAKIKEELKTNPDHVMVVLDNKQKIFQLNTVKKKWNILVKRACIFSAS